MSAASARPRTSAPRCTPRRCTPRRCWPCSGEVDAALGQPARLDLVDIGAGQGELLSQVLAAAGAGRWPGGSSRTRPKLAPRPPGLDRADPLGAGPATGDHRAGHRQRVAGQRAAATWPNWARTGRGWCWWTPATGAERSGPAVGPADLAWLRRWWPLRHLGDRAELGRPRCAAWAGVVGWLDHGVAVAADYGHRRASRPPSARWPGYRDGRPGAPGAGRLPRHHRARRRWTRVPRPG